MQWDQHFANLSNIKPISVVQIEQFMSTLHYFLEGVLLLFATTLHEGNYCLMDYMRLVTEFGLHEQFEACSECHLTHSDQAPPPCITMQIFSQSRQSPIRKPNNFTNYIFSLLIISVLLAVNKDDNMLLFAGTGDKIGEFVKTATEFIANISPTFNDDIYVALRNPYLSLLEVFCSIICLR